MSIPEQCEKLRSARIEVLVQADLMAGRTAEYAKGRALREGQFHGEGHQQMLELKGLIRKARDSIVGVAKEIDPLQDGPPGRWTSELNQHLANLDGLILRCGWRVSTYDAENYNRTISVIQEQQRYLGRAVYSSRPVATADEKATQQYY